ncbi:MAG: hypothetical protein IPG04_28690 [Polyangiaceae bacterium]|nr:hypothetical protein [Polyangiaceae bacterium]
MDVLELRVGPQADERPVGREDLNATVLLVADVYDVSARSIDGQTVWVIELAVTCPARAPDRDQLALTGEFLDTVLVPGDIHEARRVELDAAWLDELTRLGAETTPRADEDERR